MNVLLPKLTAFSILTVYKEKSLCNYLVMQGHKTLYSIEEEL